MPQLPQLDWPLETALHQSESGYDPLAEATAGSDEGGVGNSGANRPMTPPPDYSPDRFLEDFWVMHPMGAFFRYPGVLVSFRHLYSFVAAPTVEALGLVPEDHQGPRMRYVTPFGWVKPRRWVTVVCRREDMEMDTSMVLSLPVLEEEFIRSHCPGIAFILGQDAISAWQGSLLYPPQ
jgi:hypothetical protein